MDNEIIKNTIKVGNSAGVLLPKQWLNSRVKIILEPLNIKQDIINFLLNENLLENIIGVYLAGSYARKEETIDSDVDVLVITRDINKNIKNGKYDLTIISEKKLKEQIENNAFPLIPMLRESVPIINSEFINKYKQAKLTKKNIKFYLETSKSALKVIKEFLNLSEEKISDNIAYSVILRLRGVYITECLNNNKIPNNKNFLALIKKISNDNEIYFAYKRAKERPSQIRKTSITSVQKIYEYIKFKVEEQEKWIKNN
jgi:predicted nucleotidyltransferase